MITHLEPGILECEVKWALGSITTNKDTGGEGISAKLFQILKDDVIILLYSDTSKFGKLSSGHRTGKGNDKPLQYSCLENPINSVKRTKDKTLKDELPRSVGAQHATGDQWKIAQDRMKRQSQSKNNTQLYL